MSGFLSANVRNKKLFEDLRKVYLDTQISVFECLAVVEKGIIEGVVVGEDGPEFGNDNPAGFHPKVKVGLQFHDHIRRTLRRRLNLDGQQRGVVAAGWIVRTVKFPALLRFHRFLP